MDKVICTGCRCTGRRPACLRASCYSVTKFAELSPPAPLLKSLLQDRDSSGYQVMATDVYSDMYRLQVYRSQARVPACQLLLRY